jgi:hypothetical protein
MVKRLAVCVPVPELKRSGWLGYHLSGEVLQQPSSPGTKQLDHPYASPLQCSPSFVSDLHPFGRMIPGLCLPAVAIETRTPRSFNGSRNYPVFALLRGTDLGASRCIGFSIACALSWFLQCKSRKNQWCAAGIERKNSARASFEL